MGNKKLQVWLPLLLSLMMVIGMIIGFQLRDKTNSANTPFLSNPKKSSIAEVLALLREKYVDANKTDSINQIVIDNLLSHLDPHSTYIPSKMVKDVNDDLQGTFQGIGIEFQMLKDSVNITNIIKNSPSEKIGLQIGDIIIKANDTLLLSGKQKTSDQIRTSLRGELGTSIKLTLLRDGKELNLVIKRENIPIPTIDAAYIIQPSVGYIKINKFGDRTYEEFMQNLEGLQKNGMKELILDLRGNGGGLLSEAIAIADEFLDEDKLIVYTEGAQYPRTDYKCKKDGLFETGKLMVLIDETSASASEVLSGALQDWDRATLIGRRSFGKGLVQQQFQLSDGSAVRLTVARYFTPLGRNIQKPYDNKSKKDYDDELVDRYHSLLVKHTDTIEPKTKSYKTPKGHTVYGGGGITPDIPVSIDTTKSSLTYTRLFYKNTLNNFVYNYYVAHKQQFQKIKTIQELENNFPMGEVIWNELVNRTLKTEDFDISHVSAEEKTKILARIKSLMARHITRTEGFYEIYNQTDPTVLTALKQLGK